MSEPKSVPDGVPVQDKAFQHLSPRGCDGLVPSEVGRYEPVGACPDCGAPIYGPRSILNTETPVSSFTCTCREKGPWSR